MSGCCDKNPLQRSGTSRGQRLLAGLQPGYISVDERDFADWIFFADEFSRYLHFYDTEGIKNGDWKTFFSSDISALLGSIAVQEAEVYRLAVKERFDFIRNDDNAPDLAGVMQRFNELFSSLLSLSKALDTYLLKLPDKDIDGESEFVFKSTLLNLVKTKLAPALRRLLAYYFAVDGKDANNVADGSEDYISGSVMTGWKILNRPVENAETIIWNDSLGGHWWNSGEADWKTFVQNVALAPDSSIFGPASWLPDVYRRISHAVNHNLFSSLFDQYLQVYARIVQEAERSLLETLGNWNMHPPHYALFLSFLKLFRSSQSHLNGLTKRHLDFYYREVLRLQAKNALPNQAHILTELAKPVDDHALKAATGFKAGKDSEGKDITYTLDRETVFNKAKVVLLRSLYKGNASGKDDHHQTENPASIILNNRGRLFASPVANSEDGLGAKLRSAFNEWHPYVNKQFIDGVLTDIKMPHAQIGFAVASHYLFLAEGERKVRLRLVLNDNSLLASDVLDAYLTTAKEWMPVSLNPVTGASVVDSDGASAAIELSFTIPSDGPAITAYNAEVHGGTYNVNVPVLKICLKNEESTTAYSYDVLKGLIVGKVELRVEVGSQAAYSQTGLKQLALSNDFGPIDAAKPFMPFGPIPSKGASLVIGSNEAFIKKNLSVLFNIEWKDIPQYGPNVDFDPSGASANGRYPTVRLKYLSGGMWKDADPADQAIILENNTTDMVPFSTNLFPGGLKPVANDGIPDFRDPYLSYTSTSNKGFIRIQLNRDYGHDEYQSAITTYLIEKANKVTTPTYPTEPVKPYTPVMQSLYLSYMAKTVQALSNETLTNFNNRELCFFHVGPFGEAERNAYLSGKAGGPYLLPQFNHASDTGTVQHCGECYIGIEKLSAEQAVNILFQLLEGSTDPLLAKPEEHLHWSYLGNNEWKDFDPQQISDATLQLIQSGIISFAIPEDATTSNTLLPAGYLWLRAAVASAAETVCKLITVDAQAAVVSFSPDNNAADFLDTALPASTISKLKEPDTAVKKIVQPYSSFGGRARESHEHFYTRVSERLRHKARAITVWDYEHLVLEAFPSIYKVKCLNHTFFDLDPETGLVEYNEVKPGHVTLITIPDLMNRNDTNPLRPYTSQDLLSNIEEYLAKKISCHVKLKAKNPRFEEVWVVFNLKLRESYTDYTFYSEQLQEEIVQFLTPWAYGGDAEIQFGGKIQKSTLIDFIEERPYVDFITEVILSQDTNPDNEDAGGCDGTTILSDVEEAVASTARSILVSAPAKKHLITPITETGSETEADCPGLINPTQVIV